MARHSYAKEEQAAGLEEQRCLGLEFDSVLEEEVGVPCHHPTPVLELVSLVNH